MQQSNKQTRPQASSLAMRERVHQAPPSKSRRATYRIRRIPESFDRVSLEEALSICFEIRKDEFTLHSLAYDATYDRSSRKKVATITFERRLDILKVGKQSDIKISLPGEEPSRLYNISFDTTFEGFTPLTPAENEDKTHTDCILIHGWAGHPIGSFSSSDGDWFWPRDDLCHSVPALRVWLYGYHSDLRDSDSTTDVFEYADTFRRALIDARKSSDSKLTSRPLIFIVHSLGGWILQDAIIRMAASNHTDDKANIRTTKGVLLFGVPNQGMESKQLMSLLQEGDLPAAYTATLLDETRGFRLRLNQVHDFYKACSENNTIVYTFYETRETPTVCRDAVTKQWTRNGPPTLLVNQSSATYGGSQRQNMIPWSTSHNDMLKFKQGDLQHEILLHRLGDIIQRIESSQAEQDKASSAPSGCSLPPSNKYSIPFSIRGLPVTKRFVDRSTELQPLEEVLLPEVGLDRQKIFVLYGLGGIGKTQLAIEFMRRHHAKFSAVLWLDGNSEDSLKRSLGRYAGKIIPRQISTPGTAHDRNGNDNADILAKEVLDWLATADNRAWLLVFDNVDQAVQPTYDIECYLPDADHGSILITTRLMKMQQLGESREVKKVGDKTARAILKSWYKGSTYNENEMKQLLENLDGLPLAIAQAGAYMQESGKSMKAYIQLYEERRDINQLQRESSIPLRDYPNRSIWTTWNISFDAILAQDKHVAHLLILWSFLDRNDFWFGIFEEAVSTSFKDAYLQWLGSIATQASSFAAAMQLLRAYSLVEGSTHADADGYSMHAVVHRWIYSFQGLNHRADLGVLALIMVGHTVPMPEECDYTQLQRRLLGHAQMCTDKILDLQKGEDNPDMLGYIMDTADHQEDFWGAVHMLGVLYSCQSKLDKAQEMYTRALHGREKAFGPKDISTFNTLTNLGLIFRQRNKLHEAEETLTRVLRATEEAFGPKHQSTLDALCNLSGLYITMNRVDEAEKMHLQALEGLEEALEPDHIITLTFVNNLGVLYRDQGKLEEAERLYLQVLKGLEALGPKNSLRLVAIGNLGTVYLEQDKLDEAEMLLLQALQGFEGLQGPEIDSITEYAFKLGNLYIEQGRFDEAETMLERSLQGHEELFGVEYKSTIENARELSDVYIKQGKADKAETLLMRYR